MSKTFDNIAEAASTNYLFLKAQMTITLAQEPPTPPPLYALSFPSEVGCFALWLHERRFRFAHWLVKRFAPKEHKLHKWALKKHSAHDQHSAHCPLSLETMKRGSEELSVEARRESLAVAQKERWQTTEREVTQYILDHQADVAQEERWRTSMQRKMDKNFRNIKDIQESVNKGFEELVKKEMSANRDKMDKHFKDLRVELGIGVVTSHGVVAAVAAERRLVTV